MVDQSLTPDAHMSEEELAYQEMQRDSVAHAIVEVENTRDHQFAKKLRNMDCRLDTTAELIQLVRGKYGPEGAQKPYFVNWRAYIPGVGNAWGKWVYSTSEGGKNNVPDVLVHQMKMDLARKAREGADRDKDGKKVRSVFEAKNYWAYTIYRLSYFHLVDCAEEKGGTVRQWKEWRRCPDGRHETQIPRDANGVLQTPCLHCRQGVKRKFGQRSFLNLGWGMNNGLTAVERDISVICNSQNPETGKRCGGRISTVKYVCAECRFKHRVETVFLDPFNTEKSPGEVEAFWKQRQLCPRCGHKGLPYEILACTHCQKPRRTTMWDVPLYIKRQGEKQQATIVLGENALTMATPIDYSQWPDVLKEMEPMDFPAIFATTTEEQARELGLPADPFSGRALAVETPVGGVLTQGPASGGMDWGAAAQPQVPGMPPTSGK